MGNDTPVEHAASVYIPTDWRQALARGEMLPEWTSGAALFADISGFTPLTEALTQALGLRDGAEALPRHLNLVYDALIAQVDRYGGSVVSFAGDAITCWFAEETEGQASASLRATACALAMQDAMQQFATVEIPDQEPVALAVKVAVASGPARRFVVGDPAIQLMAALAGETLVRVAAAEHLAGRGDVVVDAQTVAQLGQKVQIVEWRTDAESEEIGQRFGVVLELGGDHGDVADNLAPAERLHAAELLGLGLELLPQGEVHARDLQFDVPRNVHLLAPGLDDGRQQFRPGRVAELLQGLVLIHGTYGKTAG